MPAGRCRERSPGVHRGIIQLSSLSLGGDPLSDALPWSERSQAKYRGVCEAAKVAAPARGATAILAYCHEKNRDVRALCLQYTYVALYVDRT